MMPPTNILLDNAVLPTSLSLRRGDAKQKCLTKLSADKRRCSLAAAAQSRDEGYKAFDRMLGIAPEDSPSKGRQTEIATKNRSETAPMSEEEYQQLEAEFAKRTGGLFVGTDKEAPQSLLKAKGKYTTPEMEAQRREALKAVMADYARPKPASKVNEPQMAQKPSRPGFEPNVPTYARPSTRTNETVAPSAEPALISRPARGLKHFKEQLRNDDFGESGSESMAERNARLARNSLPSQAELTKRGLTPEEIKELLQSRPKAEPTIEEPMPELSRPKAPQKPDPVPVSKSTQAQAGPIEAPQRVDPQPLPELLAPASRPSRVASKDLNDRNTPEHAEESPSEEQVEEVKEILQELAADGKIEPSQAARLGSDPGFLEQQAAVLAESVQQLERPQRPISQPAEQPAEASPQEAEPQPAEAESLPAAEPDAKSDFSPVSDSGIPAQAAASNIPEEPTSLIEEQAESKPTKSVLPCATSELPELKRPVRTQLPQPPQEEKQAELPKKPLRKNSISSSEGLQEKPTPPSSRMATSRDVEPGLELTPRVRRQLDTSRLEDTTSSSQATGDAPPDLVGPPVRKSDSFSEGTPRAAFRLRDYNPDDLIRNRMRAKYEMLLEKLHTQAETKMVVRHITSGGYALIDPENQVQAILPYSILKKAANPNSDSDSSSDSADFEETASSASTSNDSSDSASKVKAEDLYNVGDEVTVYVRTLSARGTFQGRNSKNFRLAKLGDTDEMWQFLRVSLSTKPWMTPKLWGLCAFQELSPGAISAARLLLGKQVSAIPMLNCTSGSLLEIKVDVVGQREETMLVFMPANSYAADTRAPPLGKRINIWVRNISDTGKVVYTSMVKPKESSIEDQETVKMLVGDIPEAEFFRDKLLKYGLAVDLGGLIRCKGYQSSLKVFLRPEKDEDKPGVHHMLLRRGFAAQVMEVTTKYQRSQLSRLINTVMDELRSKNMDSFDRLDSIGNTDSLLTSMDSDNTDD